MLAPIWVNAHSVGAFHYCAVSQKDVCKIFAGHCFLLHQEDSIPTVVLGWLGLKIMKLSPAKFCNFWDGFSHHSDRYRTNKQCVFKSHQVSRASLNNKATGCPKMDSASEEGMQYKVSKSLFL